VSGYKLVLIYATAWRTNVDVVICGHYVAGIRVWTSHVLTVAGTDCTHPCTTWCSVVVVKWTRAPAEWSVTVPVCVCAELRAVTDK